MSKSVVNRLLVGVCSSLMLACLASCGGGGDIAGQSATYGVSPGDATLTLNGTSESDCTGGVLDSGVTVTIVGGVAPYRIHNSDTTSAYVDKTETTGKDPTFNVRATGQACATVVVTVLDYHSNLATFKYKIEGKKPETAESTQ